MILNDVYQKILKCDCEKTYTISEKKIRCENCRNEYNIVDGYINFFKDESKRPYWSMHMQNEFHNHGIQLNMSDKYVAFEQYYTENKTAQMFFNSILDSGTVIIDLASGPSGYFGKLLKNLKPDQFFIITDGSPMIINAHKKANQDNNQIGYLDLDLDKKLPFNDCSVDCFSGRFLDNVIEHKKLISEVFRCLKNGGCYSVMELFFEDSSEASTELMNRNKFSAIKKDYISFCTSIGFILEEEGVIESYIGKLDPSDELPRNNLDKSDVVAMTFIKK